MRMTTEGVVFKKGAAYTPERINGRNLVSKNHPQEKG